MNPQAEANAIYSPALQAIQAQTPQIQQLYQTLVQGLQQQSMAQQQNVVNSAQQRGLTAPTLGTQVAGAYGQDLNLINAQMNAQRATDVAGINQQVGKTNVAKAGTVNDLAQSLLKQTQENQQNAYQMTDIERKAQLEQQQNQQNFEIQKTRYEVAEAKRAAAAAAAARESALDAASKLDTGEFMSITEAQMKRYAGPDGNVSPETYQQARDLWARKGLPVSEFDNQYYEMINKQHMNDYFDGKYTRGSIGNKTNQGSISNIKDLRF